MKKIVIRFLLFVLPILVGVGVLMYMASKRKAPVQEKTKEYTALVKTVRSFQVPAIPRIRGYGSVRPARIWNAVSQVAGKIEYVHPDFRKGAMMGKNTEIIRISPKDYKLSVQQAQANIRAAEARLKELSVTRSNTQASLKIEENSLKLKKRDLSRKRQLLRRKTVSQAAYDQEQRNLLVQSQQVQNLKNSLQLIPTQTQAQQEQLAVNKAQLDTAKLNLARTRIKMPFDGLISEDKAEETQFVTVGQVLGAVDSIKTAEIDVQFSSQKLQSMIRMLVGKPVITGIKKDTLATFVKVFDVKARVIMDMGGQKVVWDGEVVRVSDTMDPKTRTVGVVVAVKNSYEKAVPGFRPPLVKGTFVEVELAAFAKRKINILPRSAIHRGNVYSVDANARLKILPVQEIFSFDGLTVINQKLPQGKQIIISNISPAIDGMLLETTLDLKAEEKLYEKAVGSPDLFKQLKQSITDFYRSQQKKPQARGLQSSISTQKTDSLKSPVTGRVPYK